MVPRDVFIQVALSKAKVNQSTASISPVVQGEFTFAHR